ncbi:3-isopropylmalate dehydrogenase [Nakamurella antarctica]|uniref:3-isopropylmalate dehydrogenase n=1 Tax=Nakamurella antarctica TaxID=1902245 RepID=A0A3G8ZNA8_9ACTN|nr:3-isopropylmalate dehydrogenase [Nakamurella antarctica]AZI58730.1 3-isopropylmalate dehydrogenase [Nakamurella antarctica]
MTVYDLAILRGDGIGGEVTDQALKAIDAAGNRFGFQTRQTDYALGANHYLATGVVIDDDIIAELGRHQAIVFGAMGDPRVAPGVLERGLILRLRSAFRQAVNLRPVRLYPGVPTPIRDLTPERCDMVVIRENMEGMYVSGGSTLYAGTKNAVALQESINTAPTITNVVDYAFRLATHRRNRLTLCHKKNVLVHAGELWQSIVDEVGANYPDVTVDYVHADAMCQHMPMNPERFDVIVTDNLFGDIISDLGAMIQGGLGVAASGNLNIDGSAPSMFEPVHGSAPDIAGRGWANPAAAVLSAALCLASLGEGQAALALEAAAASVLAELPALAGAEMGASTDELGDRMAQRITDTALATDGAQGPSIMTAMAAVSKDPRQALDAPDLRV